MKEYVTKLSQNRYVLTWNKYSYISLWDCWIRSMIMIIMKKTVWDIYTTLIIKPTFFTIIGAKASSNVKLMKKYTKNSKLTRLNVTMYTQFDE